MHGQKRVRNRKKLHRRRIICFRNGKITITGRILKRDADKRARIPLAGADGERTPASAATDIGRKCSGAVNGTRLAAQRAAATGGRQQWHRTYTSKSARALQVSMMTRKVRACASKSASGVLTSAGKLKSPWGWPNVPPPMGFEIYLCRQNAAQRHCVSHDLRCPLGRRNQTAQRHCVSHEKKGLP